MLPLDVTDIRPTKMYDRRTVVKLKVATPWVNRKGEISTRKLTLCDCKLALSCTFLLALRQIKFSRKIAILYKQEQSCVDRFNYYYYYYYYYHIIINL
jgi:hypothetical protein